MGRSRGVSKGQKSSRGFASRSASLQPLDRVPLSKPGNPEIAAMTGVEGLLSILLPALQGEQIDRHTAGGCQSAAAMSEELRDTAAK